MIQDELKTVSVSIARWEQKLRGLTKDNFDSGRTEIVNEIAKVKANWREKVESPVENLLTLTKEVEASITFFVDLQHKFEYMEMAKKVKGHIETMAGSLKQAVQTIKGY